MFNPTTKVHDDCGWQKNWCGDAGKDLKKEGRRHLKKGIASKGAEGAIYIGKKQFEGMESKKI